MIAPSHFSIIVATDVGNGIGVKNRLPWSIRSDLEFFKTMTSWAPPEKYNVVIMGRNTYESLPKSVRPLPGRMNVVITQNRNYPSHNISCFPSLEQALSHISLDRTVHRVFVIGGTQLYQSALLHHKLDSIYLTRVITTTECDCFFPEIPSQFRVTQQTGIINVPEGYSVQFEVWRRR